jgi:Cu+-exporting ATPase
MAIMISSTLFVLFNSYRSQLAIDNTMDKVTSWPKKILASNISVALLVGASALHICSVLIATITTGGLALPVIAFTAGGLSAFCSVCSLTAIGMTGAFTLLLVTHLVTEQFASSQEEGLNNTVHQPQPSINESASPLIEEDRHDFDFSISRLHRNPVQRPDLAENIENLILEKKY